MLHVFIRCSINGTQLKVFEDGRIFKLSDESWIQLKGWFDTNKREYKRHATEINGRKYTTSRLIWKAFHPEFNLEFSSDNTIDHINRNSLDNRLCNLKVANRSEQNLNRKRMNFKNAKGCYFHKKDKKWHARISIKGKKTYLGYFETETEAHTAYLDAKAKHLGN
jgi:hypothetical protein